MHLLSHLARYAGLTLIGLSISTAAHALIWADFPPPKLEPVPAAKPQPTVGQSISPPPSTKPTPNPATKTTSPPEKASTKPTPPPIKCSMAG